MEISENTKVYFTTDAKEKNRIYIQVRIGENNFYNINGPDVKIPENTAVGVLENNFMFIDEASNLQGIDIVSNSFFSQVLDHSKDNYFTSEHKKYLIKIENDNILFLEENK